MTAPVLPDRLILQQACSACLAHADALTEAMDDLTQREIAASDLDLTGKEDRRLLDQFAYRYTRLQDDMGARLIPAVLVALGEEIATMPVLDRLSRLEQLGWLPDAEEWVALRRVRNEFAHDYPATQDERLERLQLAMVSAKRVTALFDLMRRKILERFPDLTDSR
jgi:hypothetical protein